MKTGIYFVGEWLDSNETFVIRRDSIDFPSKYDRTDMIFLAKNLRWELWENDSLLVSVPWRYDLNSVPKVGKSLNGTPILMF